MRLTWWLTLPLESKGLGLPGNDIILVHHFNVCLVFSWTSFILVYSLHLQRTQGFDSRKSQSSRNRQCRLCSLATLCWFKEKQWHWHMSVEQLVGFCLCTACPVSSFWHAFCHFFLSPSLHYYPHAPSVPSSWQPTVCKVSCEFMQHLNTLKNVFL